MPRNNQPAARPRRYALAYAFACAALGVVSLSLLGVFVAGRPAGLLPVTLGAPGDGPLLDALLVDSALLALFGVQHSWMARPGFKRMAGRLIAAPFERSTYVLASSLAVLALVFLWLPLPGIAWRVEGAPAAMLHVAGFGGLLLAAWATMLQTPSDLLGLYQARRFARGLPLQAPPFRVEGPYRLIRHPAMLGILLMFWAVPEMSAGRLLFASVMSLYILIAVRMEESSLEEAHGEQYRLYRRRVPMLIPRLRNSS